MARPRTLRVSDGSREVVIPGEAIEWQFARSSGPGGQHVNRTSSKAVLRFDVAGSPHLPADVRARILARERSRLAGSGVLVIASQEHRDQPRNVAACLDRLADVIRRCLTPPKRRRPTRTPKSAVAKRLDTKRRRSQKKQLRQRPDS
ncbi:MAG: alternative ribosome rescue aminoacyl-tRNA hydrolase ArfB [Planctomycetaceae bacterium]